VAHPGVEVSRLPGHGTRDTGLICLYAGQPQTTAPRYRPHACTRGCGGSGSHLAISQRAAKGLDVVTSLTSSPA
jgi:hypothetical protein